MKRIEAEIIADSKNQFGERITSFVLTFPRIILAELNTHRAFSKNSASSRAVPFKTMLRNVMSDPFIPIRWMKDHKGMQGDQYFTGFSEWLLIRLWLIARTLAVCLAWILNKIGLTKQIVNRLLEPFMWHTAIVTATDLENFFALRAHDAAEIHFKELAYKVLKEYNNSFPVTLKDGQWHIPFGNNLSKNRIEDTLLSNENYVNASEEEEINEIINKQRIKISTARCARVSYINFEGRDDYEADIKLHDQLLSSGHMSPFEHCAMAINQPNTAIGNFTGFLQYRKLLENENRSDSRVIKK
jgi:thymidylate synthase ThyX